MKETVERRLGELIGKPFIGMFRFVGIQAFEFGDRGPGKNYKGEDVFRADQRLHVSCSWCITGPEGVVVSSEDFGRNGVRSDEQAHPFYHMINSHPLLVEAIEADEQGAIRLQMSRGYSLEVQPDEPEDEPDEDSTGEQWRFLPKDKRRRHLVITAQGIQR
jgi:hypothetical protein